LEWLFPPADHQDQMPLIVAVIPIAAGESVSIPGPSSYSFLLENFNARD
jgi:hypothetical protein